MEKFLAGTMAILIGFVLGAIIGIAATLWLGFVACIVWDWFIAADAGFQLPHTVAYGCTFLSSLYVYKYRHTHASTEQDPFIQQLIAGWIFSFIFPAVILFGAWIMHWWIT